MKFSNGRFLLSLSIYYTWTTISAYIFEGLSEKLFLKQIFTFTMQVNKRLIPACHFTHLHSIVSIQSNCLLGYILNCGAISGPKMGSPLATTFCLLEYEIFRKIVLRGWGMDSCFPRILLTMDRWVWLLKALANRNDVHYPNRCVIDYWALSRARLRCDEAAQ